MLVIFTDGASLGNPGPMGIGIVIYKDGVVVEELGEYIGDGTNNVAEYRAIIKALETAHSMGESDVHVKSDSQLVVRQLNNEYKVKDPGLRPLRERIAHLSKGLNVRFEHIPREKNSEADKLSKEGAEIGRMRKHENNRKA
ncbi:MAG TPA: ribonuclease HI family protein [Candidatus Bilamarchaeum sp.]|nr:ribonuclease HI family protein [Candidatus Bilamarchaeum sp.]